MSRYCSTLAAKSAFKCVELQNIGSWRDAVKLQSADVRLVWGLQWEKKNIGSVLVVGCSWEAVKVSHAARFLHHADFINNLLNEKLIITIDKHVWSIKIQSLCVSSSRHRNGWDWIVHEGRAWVLEDWQVEMSEKWKLEGIVGLKSLRSAACGVKFGLWNGTEVATDGMESEFETPDGLNTALIEEL